MAGFFKQTEKRVSNKQGQSQVAYEFIYIYAALQFASGVSVVVNCLFLFLLFSRYCGEVILQIKTQLNEQRQHFFFRSLFFFFFVIYIFKNYITKTSSRPSSLSPTLLRFPNLLSFFFKTFSVPRFGPQHLLQSKQ